ncbi:hypothetical protein NliqN6_5310 [Naganishia liquefaciens]|uniref:Mitochondrial carrier protein n=1 Tax=Naganishia liquefaciens TaxID=104408 RepID=A0A8H3TY00_9TREE|nr:hypothetical protein NliqN6_5310 [Naganishia liquefaciens]
MLASLTRNVFALVMSAPWFASALIHSTPEGCFSTFNTTWATDLNVCPTDDVAYVGLRLQYDIQACLDIDIYAALGKRNDSRNAANLVGCGHSAGVSRGDDFPVLLPEQLRPSGAGLVSLQLLCGIKQSGLETSDFYNYAFHLKTSNALGFSHTSAAGHNHFRVRRDPQYCSGSSVTTAASEPTSTVVRARGKRAIVSESSTTLPPSTTTVTEAASTPVASLQMSRRASLLGPPLSLLCPQGQERWGSQDCTALHRIASHRTTDSGYRGPSSRQPGRGMSTGTDGPSIDASDQLDPKIDFLAGTVAGVAGLIVGQPFDTIKVRFQSTQYANRYSSTFGALMAIARDEKPRSLFRGVTSPMAGIAFVNGLIFSSYGFFLRVQTGAGNGDGIGKNGSSEPSLWQIGLAGAGSGVMASFITCPTELIKIRQQSSTAKIAPTTIGTVKHIIRQDGVSGLYRGFGSTAGRELAYGTYFFTYEGICRYFRNKRRRNDSPPPSSIHHSAYAAHRQKPDPLNADGLSPRHEHRVHHESLIEEAENELEELSWGELMIAGGCAGTASWLATFPLDTIKTRIQGMSLKTGEKMPSTLSVTRNIIRKEGWRCLFHGLTPTLIRAFPTNAVVFLSFEAIITAFR